jgi:DNA-binding CsgD family transcriptional regulator
MVILYPSKTQQYMVGMVKQGSPVTLRLKEIKVLLLEGNTVQEVADALGLARNTVGRTMAKYGIKSPRKSGPRPKPTTNVSLTPAEVFAKIKKLRQAA